MTTHQSSCWKSPLHSALWQNQEIYTLQQEEDVERKDRRPYLLLHRCRCQGSKEPVILRANTPRTLPEKKKRRGRDQNRLLQSLLPVGRHPYDYDALMGITRVGTKEAEGFEEDLDSTEYHDATEEPIKKEETDGPQLMLRSAGFQGRFGSSSLKECIELLNATVIPLLHSTLGSVERIPIRHRL